MPLKTLTQNHNRFNEYKLLMRVDKPIGILLLLWPTWWALWVAGEGFPDLFVFLVFTIGVFLMRSAGCVINDYADRDIDNHVTRTKHRPLAEKRVSEKDAILLFIGLCLTAFALVLFMNILTIALSFVGVLLAACYPFMKRYMQTPQLVLGVAFAWSIPMAFAAQTGEVPYIAWVIFFANIAWTTAYDTMYAMVDRVDDIKIGVKSTAILFGKFDRLFIGLLQIATIVLLVHAGLLLSFGTLYYLGLFTALCLGIYQQLLLSHNSEKYYFQAFLNNNWFGLSIFAGIFLHYIFA